MEVFDLNAPVARNKGSTLVPGDGVKPLPLAAQLGKGGHGCIQPHQRIPCGRTNHTIGVQIEYFLEGCDGILCGGTENAVHGRNLRNGRVVLGYSVQLCLDDHHIGAYAASSQRRPGIGRHIVLHRGIGHDFHVPIVAAQNLGGVVALLGKGLAAPLAQAFAGDGGAVAKFCGQRFYKARAAQIGIEKLIHQPGNVGKKAAPPDKELVIGGGAGDVKIIASAAVELCIYPV